MRTVHGDGTDGAGVSGAAPAAPGLARRGAFGLIAAGLVAGPTILPSPARAAPASTWPGSGWTSITPAAAGFSSTKFTAAVNHAKSKGGSGFVSRYGYKVGAWGSATQKYDVKSATKSIGSLLISLGITQGLIQLQDTALSHLDPEFGVPPESNRTVGGSWRDRVTLQYLLDHTAGFAKPGGFEPLLFTPGAYYLYSDGGTNWFADIMTVRFGGDLQEVFRQRIATPVGIPGAESSCAPTSTGRECSAAGHGASSAPA